MKFGWSTVENLNAIDGTMKYFVGSGTAAPLMVLAMTAEFLGPLALAVGFLTRIAALGIACVMLVPSSRFIGNSAFS